MAEVNIDVALESTSQEILDKVTEGVEVNFRSPIAITHGSFFNGNSGLVLEGTGKGKLFLSVYMYNILNAVIDGKTISLGTGDSSIGQVEVEFTESFSISVVYDGSGDYASGSCVAVFY